MNEKAAISEARRRWGPTGGAFIRRGKCCVSHAHRLGWVEEIVGTGATWEEAFTNADRQDAIGPEKEDKMRMPTCKSCGHGENYDVPADVLVYIHDKDNFRGEGSTPRKMWLCDQHADMYFEDMDPGLR